MARMTTNRMKTIASSVFSHVNCSHMWRKVCLEHVLCDLLISGSEGRLRRCGADAVVLSSMRGAETSGAEMWRDMASSEVHSESTALEWRDTLHFGEAECREFL